jgi:hypothetical protein
MIYLILIAVVLVFGLGVLLLNRRRSVPQAPAARPLPPQPKKPAPLPATPAATPVVPAPVEAEAESRANVWLFVGVNGVGKTTTIGKLGKRLQGDERPPGADGRRRHLPRRRRRAARPRGPSAAGAEIVRGAEGGDPSAIIFDAIESAAARGADLVLADTAGRLHTKTNLMEELRKVRRVADKDPATSPRCCS